MKLAAVFSDNMVFQHGIKVPVWGWAAPGDTVTLEFAGQKKTAVAKKDGTWSLKLDKLPISGEPREIRVSSRIDAHQSKITNVLIGEVWVCSGQSNMSWMLMNASNSVQETAAEDSSYTAASSKDFP